MSRRSRLLKKFKLETILNIPGHVSLSNVDVWFQDEARFGQQNTTTRLWARRGSRPRAVQQQQFESAYLFGAVCPATGATEALLSPLVNREVMKQHLALIQSRGVMLWSSLMVRAGTPKSVRMIFLISAYSSCHLILLS